MRPRLFSMLLLLALLWQTLVAVMPSSVAETALALGHEFVHQEGQGHHHVDDVSLQVDEQGAPMTHVHHDAGQHHAFLLPSALTTHGRARAAPQPSWARGCLPAPCLEGPLRPPRLST